VLIRRNATEEWRRPSSTFNGALGEPVILMDASPGPWDVRVVPRGWPAVEVERVETDGGTVVVRMPPGPAIEGRVVDPDGRPVNDAEVRLAPLDELPPWSAATVRCDTGEDGRFAFRGIPAEPRRLVAWAWRLGYAALGPVQPGTGEVELRLPPKLALRGTVRGGTGEPLPDVPVTLLLPGGHPVRTWRTRADGAFEFHAAPPGVSLTLLVRPPGSEAPLVREIAADAPRDGVEIVVR
jgi:hypothetical protein